MTLKQTVLFVGPINDQGLGGRFEEMRIWARFLEQEKVEVSVFSMFNSQFAMENARMFESAQLEFPTIWSRVPGFRKLLLRIWGAKIFRTKRDCFYSSNRFIAFAGSFDHIILFITHQSKEMKIFESTLPVPVSIRFTGTVHDSSKLQNHHTEFSKAPRNYVIHSPRLLKRVENSIPKVYIDQTSLSEKSLLELELDSNLKVFAMIGLFMEVKQMEEVINVFDRLPNLNLVIFGTGSLQGSFQAKIDKLSLDNVKIAGFVPPDQIAGLYSQIDALIINSSEETGPMTGIEAMAAGKFILSRPVGAMQERLNDEDLIFDDLEVLVEKINKFVAMSSEKIVEKKLALRTRYQENYSNLRLKNQIIRFLEEGKRK